MRQVPPALFVNPPASLKTANAQAWARQNCVDQRLKNLQDVHAFAEPLLVGALKARYGLDLDVRDTHLYLHTSKGWLLKGSVSRTVSLLDAALHNFARHETFIDTSCYITRPDTRRHFNILPLHRQMSIQQFIVLCRELDLGTRYQQHLREHLLPRDSHLLQRQVIASQQAMLNAAAHLALHRGEIDATVFHLVQRTLKGERGVMQFYRLQMLDTVLTGILLIAADLDSAKHPSPVIVYIPHDPQTPLKAYADTHAFMLALTARLQDNDYRTFFSQFVDQQQRGRFFSTLAQRLSHIQYHPRKDVIDMRPPWRDTPIEKPQLAFAAVRIDGELWTFLYQRSLDKILNDGRELAVSTADADSKARWAWWDNVSQLLSDILNAALLVATPFVPLLGEVMLAYTAWQLLDEVVEGALDLAEGQALEATTHLLDVLNEMAQLAAFGVATTLVPSAFVNQLKVIEVQGRQRLWHPDPAVYEQHNVQLAPQSLPDEEGLHLHEGRHLLPVDGRYYRVERDEARGGQCITHPTRADAYAPPIQLNSTPRAWTDQRRLRELGPFSREQQQQILAASGLDHDTLRAIQTDNPPSPILADTLKRTRLNQQAGELPMRLRQGEPVDDDTYWSPHLALELPGWPVQVQIAVFESADLSGVPMRFGAQDASRTLDISRHDLNQGKLPERLASTLAPPELHALLGELPVERQACIEALRERLARLLTQRHASVFDYLYRHSENAGSELAARVREVFPDLPDSVVQHVLSLARPDERAILETERRLPLRLKNIARELHLQTRTARGVQGFHTPSMLDANTEQMVLRILQLHSNALAHTRIEVRPHHPRATVRASAGPADARHMQALVRTDGHYQLYAQQRPLSAPYSDFFEAVLHALPAGERVALGFDAEHFKAWVAEHLRTPEQRRTALAGAETAPTPARDTQVLLQKPMLPVRQWFCQLFPESLEERVKNLYPRASRADIDACLGSLEDLQWLARFEARVVEKATLQQDLSTWMKATEPHDQPVDRQRRLNLTKDLLYAWEQNINPPAEGCGLLFNGIRLSGLLGNLRLQADFSHITHLELINADLLDSDTPFLSHFTQLRGLNLQRNLLTQLPPQIAPMASLSHLDLSGNPIHWVSRDLDQLGSLRPLQFLSLADNRELTRAPPIGRLPALHSLILRNTGINDWPDGLFELPRTAQFLLDLRNTAIERIPQFLPWAPEAELIAQVRLDRNRLTPEAEKQLISYRLEAGFDPYRSYPPKGDAEFWLKTEPQAHQPWLAQLWEEVEHEHGSQGFFEVIKSLEPPEFFEVLDDARLYRLNRKALTSKVWRMLLAMQRDETLRSRLFTLADNPVTCADAGAHLFNAMGLEVQLAEIGEHPHGPLHDVQLTQLARGKARLDRLNQVARADIRHRVTPTDRGGLGLRFNHEVVAGLPGSVDEVEVYLAYQSGLQRRLDLPWVSEHMTYRLTSGVGEARLNEAYDEVTGLEAGDGLADGMLEQPFWDTFLRERHADLFQASRERAEALMGPLDDLMFAQNAWASAEPAEREILAPGLLALADTLKVSHADVLSGAPMSARTYEHLLAAGFSEDSPSEQTLARRLTCQFLARLSDYESGHGTPTEDK
ncbi:hypothetical protein HX792_04165 [Pseudomonas sp. B6002]|uniref:NEL-type E3 ubiquitin ligase domain-containing protein n=1 Tax=Pseudomonas sp. B6002 TaxID=2726978 RepID=UPI0015A3F013|nr:NEL-type E3 ubiquitin ligase domain-containing protein [Pseudomonas sp. B6002]NVZ49519.1 hypothetical protein [Pseudomonas sp. B6002]